MYMKYIYIYISYTGARYIYMLNKILFASRKLSMVAKIQDAPATGGKEMQRRFKGKRGDVNEGASKQISVLC